MWGGAELAAVVRRESPVVVEPPVATRRTWYAWSGDPVPRFWRPGTGPWVRRAGTVAVSVTPSSR